MLVLVIVVVVVARIVVDVRGGAVLTVVVESAEALAAKSPTTKTNIMGSNESALTIFLLVVFLFIPKFPLFFRQSQ